MATHSSILAWEIPWTEESGGLLSMGSQRVRHDRAYMHTPGRMSCYLWRCRNTFRRAGLLGTGSSKMFLFVFVLLDIYYLFSTGKYCFYLGEDVGGAAVEVPFLKYNFYFIPEDYCFKKLWYFQGTTKWFSYTYAVCCLVTKLCLSLFATPWTVCNLPVSSVHGISQANILEWVVISFSRGSSRPRDWTRLSCIGRQILYHWATREAHVYIYWTFNFENPFRHSGGDAY